MVDSFQNGPSWSLPGIIPTSWVWYSHSYVIPSPWGWTGHVTCFWPVIVMGCYFYGYVTKYSDFCLANRLSPLMALLRKLPSWRGLCGKELRVASSQQPARNWDPQYSSPRWTEFWQQPNELGSISCLSWTFRWDSSPGWHFDCSLMNQRIRLSCGQIPDPQKLWDKNCVLF